MKRGSKMTMAALALSGSVTAVLASQPLSASAAANSSTLVIGQTSAFDAAFIPDINGTVYTGNIVASAFDSLMNLDSHLNYIPWLATKWKWSKDKKTVTMWLRKGAKWSDGKPITADDVLFTMDYLASPAYTKDLQGSYASEVGPVVGSSEIEAGKKTSFAQTGGFKKINNYEFQMTFQTVDAAVLYSDMSWLTPLPKHVLGKIPIKDWGNSSFNKMPSVVSGPYEFVKVNGQNNVEMKANPLYWAGKAHIENLVWRTVNTNVAPGLLVNGGVTMQYGLQPQDVPKMQQTQGIVVKTLPGNGYTYMGLNLQLPQFQNVKLRQAMEYAINRQAIIKGIEKGLAIPVSGPMPPISWAAATPKDGLNPYNYNPKKAEQLLDAAGWKIGKGGKWRIDPTTGKIGDLHLIYSSGISTVQSYAITMQQMLEAVGLKVTLDTPIDFNSLWGRLNNHDKKIQMWLAGWGLPTYPDPRWKWLSNDGFNLESWKDPHNDALIGKTYSAKAFNQAYHRKVLVQWQLYVNQQLPELFLWDSDNVYAYSSKLHIPAKDWTPTGPINYQDWTLSN